MLNIDRKNEGFAIEFFSWAELENGKYGPARISFQTETTGLNLPQTAGARNFFVQHATDVGMNNKFDQNIAELYFDASDKPNELNLSLALSSPDQDKSTLRCLIEKKQPGELTIIDSEKMSNWLEFKEDIRRNYLGNQENYTFRGQSGFWPLRTLFHRCNRYRLLDYLGQDIEQLQLRLCSVMDHFFNLNDGIQLGSFIHLLQHHGYPTPFLDWSISPYIAAFFAFEGLADDDQDGHVCVFTFNRALWAKDFNQMNIIEPGSPHVSFREFAAIKNNRAMPQQAVTTITNIDDIEAYITGREKVMDTHYLHAIAIPKSEKNTAMNDLRLMGITKETLFPGIDTTCAEFKMRNFKWIES